MEFYSMVFDDEKAMGTLYVVDVVGLVDHTECRRTTCTGTGCSKVFTFVIFDSEFSVFFPETPNAVGTESFVTETEVTGFLVVIDDLACAIGFGRCIGYVVPLHVLLCAGFYGFNFVFFDFYGEIGQYNTIAIAAGECE